ncbi:MAG: ATP cone domain-containing protein [Candidatus Bilamarchaeaceae archaeon]
MISKIVKRNGTLADFDSQKISNAIWKAAKSVGGQDRKRAEELAQKVVSLLEEKFKSI